MKTNEENRGIPNWMRYKSASVDLSGSETYLFPDAFCGNRYIERVILPEWAEKVPRNIFKGCTKLKEVTLPADSDIRESAFEGCVALTDIYLPLCIGNIAANAFKGCPENIRFHMNSPIINPEKLKQHIEKELGRSIELYDSTGNGVTVSAGTNREICNL